MKCPYCLYHDSKVTDKRDSDKQIRRRRECLKCKKRFTTYERFELSELFVSKKDGRRELFNREKLKAGITRACEKRPVSQEEIEIIVNNTEEKLRKKGKEVKTKAIGEIVMKALREVDKVAYIRFASVYREFEDIGDFGKELKELRKTS